MFGSASKNMDETSNNYYMICFRITIFNPSSTPMTIIDEFEVITSTTNEFDVVLLEDIEREKKICRGYVKYVECTDKSIQPIPHSLIGVITRFYAADCIVMLYKYDPSLALHKLKVDDIFSKTITQIGKKENAQYRHN